jgi:hypothetical protein
LSSNFDRVGELGTELAFDLAIEAAGTWRSFVNNTKQMKKYINEEYALSTVDEVEPFNFNFNFLSGTMLIVPVLIKIFVFCKRETRFNVERRIPSKIP